MQFVKMHGIGNDYVFVDTFKENVPDPAQMARSISPRRFSVGSDGLILIGRSEKADARMRIFNADGSEAEMCGNGIRCVAKYVWEHDICRKNPMTIETGAGIKKLELFFKKDRVASVRVDMGEPRFKRGTIPIRGPEEGEVVNENLEIDDLSLPITCVSTGNPHCIIPVDDFSAVKWRELGPVIERHQLFPERVNVHFVRVISENEVEVKTWERGSGATLACGTGASAVCAATCRLGLTGRKITVQLPGGSLDIEWRESNNRLYMTGPAVEVFTGHWG